MELLTPDGWSQAYRMEAVILQTMATMIKGVEEDSRGRADPTASPALPGPPAKGVHCQGRGWVNLR